MMQKVLPSGKFDSIWNDFKKPKKFPALKKNIDTEVAIIGGGIAGINCAYMLKQKGYNVVLIDEKEIGKGITSRTTAKITYGHGLIYSFLLKKFGFKKAKQYANANNLAIDKFEEIIKKEKIRCDFQRRDFYIFTEDRANYRQMQDEFYSLRKIFMPVELVEKIDLEKDIIAAIKFPHQAQFHPLKFIYALAGKINGNGSYIFENTKAIDIKENEQKCTVVTENGNINAEYVIVATHFPFFDPAFYYTRMYPSKSYALAAKTKKFPKDMYMNTESPGRTYRKFTENIVIYGGEGHKFASEDEVEHYRNLYESAKKDFGVSKLTNYWSAFDYITMDRVPYIGRISSSSSRVFIASGFGKWGMSSSMVSAIVISDLIEEGKSPLQDVFNPLRIKPITSARSFLKENIDVAEKYILSRLSTEEEKLIPQNEGRIIEIKGKKYAAYKDSSGKTNLFNPYCTHLGCMVKWNSAENSWDCPCHGSSFSPMGKVIHGPALKDLKEEKIKD